MYRVLVVEDEGRVARQVSELAGRYADEHGLSFGIQALPAAFEALSLEQTYDICLLDIDLPGINGMEAAAILRLNDRARSIVFITNLAQYAVRGYEVGAAGFVVKPVGYSSLSLALDRAVRELRASERSSVAVGTGTGSRVVRLDDLEYVEACRHGILLCLTDGEKVFSPQTLAELEAAFPAGPLLRVSRAQLANMDKISEVSGNNVVMAGGATLRIPKGKKRELLETVASYLGSKR